MKRSNVLAVIKKNLQQIKRDPRMMVLIIIAPIIVTTLFGFAFGGELKNLRVLVVNNDDNFSNIIADEIIEKIDEDPKIYLNTSTSDPDLVKQAVDNNYSQAAIIFPIKFTNNLLLGKSIEIELYISYKNPTVANYILSLFENCSNDVLGNYMGSNPLAMVITTVYQGASGPLPSIINISLSNFDEGWKQNPLSSDVYDLMVEDDILKVEDMDSIEKAKDMVQKGKARALIVFPEDFTYDALTKKEINLQLKIDGSIPQACASIKGAISSIISEVFEEKFDKSTFNLDDYYYNNAKGTNEPISNTTYFSASVMVFIIFFFSFLLTMLSFLRERTQGTMERLLTTPLQQDDIIIGYLISFSIIALIQSSAILFAIFFLFSSGIQFSLWIVLQIYLIIYLLVLAALGTGIFLSTLAKTEFQIIQFIPLVILPFLILSGILAPLEALPNVLRSFSGFIPLTYAKSALTDILLRGLTIFDILFELGFILAYSLTMITLGIIVMNKKR